MCIVVIFFPQQDWYTISLATYLQNFFLPVLQENFYQQEKNIFTQPVFSKQSHNAITVLVFPEPVAITSNAFLRFFHQTVTYLL